MGSLFLLQGIFPTQIKPRSPTLQVDSLPAEPQGKLKNTGVDSFPFSSRSSEPGIEPGSPALQADSLPTELFGNIVYSTIKKDEVIPFVATWMDLEIVILSEVCQAEKDNYHMRSHMESKI